MRVVIASALAILVGGLGPHRRAAALLLGVVLLGVDEAQLVCCHLLACDNADLFEVRVCHVVARFHHEAEVFCEPA